MDNCKRIDNYIAMDVRVIPEPPHLFSRHIHDRRIAKSNIMHFCLSCKSLVHIQIKQGIKNLDHKAPRLQEQQIHQLSTMIRNDPSRYLHHMNLITIALVLKVPNKNPITAILETLSNLIFIE